MANFPAINGFHYSYASITIASDVDVTHLIKEISYSTKRERGIGRGTSGRKVLRTKGEENHEASVTFYRKEFDEFVSRHGDGFMDKELDWTISYAEEGLNTVTDKLERCVVDSVEAGGSEGTDPSEVPCDLNPMDIEYNGVKGMIRPNVVI